MFNNVPVVFRNGSNFSYYFIIKELTKSQFECLGENTEKYKIFSFPIEKQTREVDKDGNKDIITTSFKIKFIDSARFLARSLSNLVDTLPEGIHKIKCKDCKRLFLKTEVSMTI